MRVYVCKLLNICVLLCGFHSPTPLVRWLKQQQQCMHSWTPLFCAENSKSELQYNRTDNNTQRAAAAMDEEDQLARALAASLADVERQNRRLVARTDQEEQEALSLAMAQSLADLEEQQQWRGGQQGVCANNMCICMRPKNQLCRAAACTCCMCMHRQHTLLPPHVFHKPSGADPSSHTTLHAPACCPLSPCHTPTPGGGPLYPPIQPAPAQQQQQQGCRAPQLFSQPHPQTQIPPVYPQQPAAPAARPPQQPPPQQQQPAGAAGNSSSSPNRPGAGSKEWWSKPLKLLDSAVQKVDSAVQSIASELGSSGCAGCGRAMGLGPTLRALGKEWHPGCFRCAASCHRPLNILSQTASCHRLFNPAGSRSAPAAAGVFVSASKRRCSKVYICHRHGMEMLPC